MLTNKKHLDANHIVFQPGRNEELAATVVFGSQTLHCLRCLAGAGAVA